jgi:hypothetical protein
MPPLLQNPQQRKSLYHEAETGEVNMLVDLLVGKEE